MDFSYQTCIAYFVAVVYIFHLYLDVRQLRELSKTSPPTRAARYQMNVSQEEYLKTQAYQIDKWWFGVLHGSLSTLLDLYVLTSQCLPWIWALAQHIVAQHGFGWDADIQISIVFIGLFGGASMIIDIPWSLYSTFVVEERHGFNKQTLRLYIKDQVVSVLLAVAVGPLLIAGIVWVLRLSGQRLVFFAWGFMLAVQIIALVIYHPFIAPLFNKFTPVPQGSLRERIEELASGLKFPLRKLYVIDGSTRSAHSNAYFFGFWPMEKRIVLFDTLMEQCDEEQIVAVLAHELGHWKMGHTLRGLVLAQAVLLFRFAAFSLAQGNQKLLTDFGFSTNPGALIPFMLFSFLLSPLDSLLDIGNNVMSRRWEFQADGFAVEQGKGEGLMAGLLKLESTNRSAANVDPWYSAVHYSHPPTLERLAAIDALMKKQQ